MQGRVYQSLLLYKQYSTGKQGTAQKSHANVNLRFACKLSAGQSVPVGFGDEAQAKATGFEAQAKAKVQAKPPKGFEARSSSKSTSKEWPRSSSN